MSSGYLSGQDCPGTGTLTGFLRSPTEILYRPWPECGRQVSVTLRGSLVRHKRKPAEQIAKAVVQ